MFSTLVIIGVFQIDSSIKVETGKNWFAACTSKAQRAW